MKKNMLANERYNDLFFTVKPMQNNFDSESFLRERCLNMESMVPLVQHENAACRSSLGRLRFRWKLLEKGKEET